jgi:predicted glycoside hydrolase/deacetylase ChbG (UPF0249 family)
MYKYCLASLLFFVGFVFNAGAQSNTIRLIIRGDDMGYAHSGNEALIKCYKEGIEKSIEIIAPSPWFPEAVTMLNENPGVDVGVHLALTSEWDNEKWRPLTDCPSLRDADGYFFPMVWPNKNYPGRAITQNKWNIADIEKELRAQIELVKRKVPRVSHLSAHMGCIGLDATVALLAKKLAAEYGLPIETGDVKVTYIGYSGPHKTSAEKIESFIATLDTLKPGNTYLFLDHPGLNTPELQAIHHIGYETVAEDRQGVTDLFSSEKVKEMIKKKGIVLISYKDLQK